MSEYAIGEVFQDLRKQYGYKITDFMPVVTKSTIHRFENGESELSVVKFQYALKRMGITMTEFESIAHDFILPDNGKSLKQLYPLYYQRNEKGLLELSESTHDQYIKLAARALYNELTTGKSLSLAAQEKLIEFVFEQEIWGTYELTILNATISELGSKRISLALEELYDSTENHQYNSHFSRRISLIYSKGAFTLVRKNQAEKAQLALSFAREVTKSDDLFSLTMLLFNEGVYQYRFGVKKNGLDKIREAIHIFEVLGSSHHADFIRFILNKYILISEPI